MITWAVKLEASFGGSSLALPQTFPLFISLTETPLTLKPTLSPGIAS